MELTPRKIAPRLCVIFALWLAFGSATAHADANAEGTVLKIDGGDIYIDLGAKSGVGSGSSLTLMHVIVAKNPVTGKSLRDRFPLGTLKVVKAGSHLCIARASQKLLKRIRVGDEVKLASAPRTFEDPWQTQLATRKRDREARAAARKKAQMPKDPAARLARIKAERAAALAQANKVIGEAEAAKGVWQATLGKAPKDRIAMWEAFLAGNPDSPYSKAVNTEIASLRQQMAAEAALTEKLVEPDTRQADLRVQRLASLQPGVDLDSPIVVHAPKNVYQGTEVHLSFTVLAPRAVERAWLYYRQSGEGSFHRTNLTADGDMYMRGSIPADAVKPPGIELFVEVSGPGDEAPAPVIGSQEYPKRISVQKQVEERPADIDNRSRVTLFTDYVDFDGGFGNGFDQYIHAEVDFMYRFYKPIYAVRVGFGTLGGIGGPKDIIDNDPETCLDDGGNYRCRRVTFTYAYAEFEYRLKNQPISVMVRPQFGNGSLDSRRSSNGQGCFTGDRDLCEIFSSAGLRLRLRIGEERKTNLTLGVGVTQQIGTVFEAAYSWDVIPKFPIKISAQVTDQPVPEDYGVRLIGDIGWRSKFDWLYPSVRISYQARDVDHAGLSGGAAINFDW